MSRLWQQERREKGNKWETYGDRSYELEGRKETKIRDGGQKAGRHGRGIEPDRQGVERTDRGWKAGRQLIDSG